MTPGMAQIRLETTGVRKTLVVNGEDIGGQVARLFLDAGHDDVTRVGVEFVMPDLVFEGEGIVEVLRNAEQPDPKEFILGFLEAVDPEILEERMLKVAGFEATTGQAALMALTELINGGA